ncbi:MAG: Protein InvG [Pseudomonas sp.]|nr:MAG: Protein InvG [Pseudomonas sp.]
MSLHLRRCWLFLCVLLVSPGALGERYQAHEESLHTFFSALAVPLGQPVVVSQAAARKRISGEFAFEQVQQVLESVASQQGLIWYDDGQAVYLYDASEAKSAVVALRHLSVERLREWMRRSGLDEKRHPLRVDGRRVFSVSGPPTYVDQVQRLAQLMDRPRPELRLGTQTFAVVQVLNTHVADRQYDMGGKTVTVPGIASVIDTLLAAERTGGGLLAYADTNSVLVKGTPAQVTFIEQLVAQLDVPKRAVEVSLWWVDVERDALAPLKLGEAATRVLAPREDNAFISHVTALERRRRARVSVLPVILTQENVPAVFQDNQTLYLPGPDAGQSVVEGTQVSVLPRFAEGGEIELVLRIEDDSRQGGAKVKRVGIDGVVRLAPGKRVLVGDFQRGAGAVRLFVIQARAGSSDLKAMAGAPPALTASQHERVKRAFKRVSAP